MLDVRDLNVHYKETHVLHNVSLRVDRGEVISLIGSNGAGKTTLLNAIIGLVNPSSGSIHYNGTRIDGLKPYDIAKMGIGYVPEGGIFPYLTVLENLKMGAYLCRDSNEAKRMVEQFFELFPDLKGREEELAGSLSGGEQRMLLIQRSLMNKPKFLMLDEPSTGLMPALVGELFGIIDRISNEATILLVEQNVYKACKLCDRAYVMDNGRIMMEGTGKKVLASDEVKQAYLGV